jgi:hypothetical protein
MPLSMIIAVLVSALWRSGGDALFGGRSRTAMLLRRTAAAVSMAVILMTAAALAPLDEHLAEIGLSSGRGFARERFAEIRSELAAPHERTGRAGASPLVEYIRSCTKPQSRILALTFAPELFFYTGRAFAGGHVALPPGYFVGERHASLMLQRLSREDVPLVVLDSETSAEMGVLYPRVMAHVAGRYREAGRFAVGGDKDFIVLVERTRTPARFVSGLPTGGALAAAGGGLPCFTPPTSS